MMHHTLRDIQGASRAARALHQQLSSLCGSAINPGKVRRSQSSPQPRSANRAAPLTQNISQLDRPAASPARTGSTIPRPREPEPLLAHEYIKGQLVKYSTEASTASRQPPTIVLVHGILGSRRNMQSFARRIVEGFPAWQVLLVDLRCHGDSAPLSLSNSLQGPHGVASAAADVITLLASLKLFPEVLIGHSFGGKVVMSMAHQFGATTRRLPRPVKVWVLDALPGEVRSGEMGATDRPVDLITALQRMPLPIADKSTLIMKLEAAGFSPGVASWAALNLAYFDPSDKSRGMGWTFDLNGIAQMYRSYEETDLWQFLTAPAEGINLAFVKAERSSFRWGGGDEDRIIGLGHPVHVLRNSGHWVHTDNPDELFDILAPTFGGPPDIHMQRSPSVSPSVSRQNSLNN